MQCPKCSSELDDQARCPSCDRKDEASAEMTTDTPESTGEQEVAGVSHEPHSSPVAPPQAADSADPIEKPDPSPAPQAQPKEPDQSDSEGSVGLNRSTLSAHGDITLIGQLIARMDKTEPDAKIEERSLYDLTKRLPSRTAREYHLPQPELAAIVGSLRENRLILISCSHPEYAFDAAYDVMEKLAVANPDQNRIISYEDTDGNLTFNVQKLLERRPEAEGDSVVLVDALNTLARTFPNSILGHLARADAIKEDLITNRHFLVIIVDLNYAREKNLAHQHFPYREVPFLRPFLKKRFPGEHERLEAQIRSQREQGVWEKDEVNFCRQIIGYDEAEQLLKVVEGGGPKDPETSAEALLKESSQVKKAVLYTTAFFQEITLVEFYRVVEALLDGKTMSVPAPANGGGNGDAPAQTQSSSSKVPLSLIWQEEKDSIFTEWLRETSAGKDSVRVVGLSNSALREPLRRLFERRHRFYLIDQFNALQERGIFFYPSLRLAESTTQIAVDMVGFYPDEFNETWIVELISRVREYVSSGSAGATGEEAMFRYLRNSKPGAWNLALARVSDLFRLMLESPQLEGRVHSTLEQLINGGYHEDTLLLIKQLQFTPKFDELYWFKQLLHRADSRTRHLTYYYLYSYLRRMGSGVYEGLKKIEAWLPPAERHTYSQFDYFVLRLLIQYCVESVERFNAKHYGNWPSRYPLFATIKDLETANECTSLLAKWLLHPGINATLKGLRFVGTQMTLTGALLAEWTFILIGPGEPPADDGGEFSAELSDLLIKQFVSRTDLAQRLELLTYWNRLSNDLLKFAGNLPYASELRKELGWKRKLVGRLITKFKKRL